MELLVIEPTVFGDHRGWFMETYSEVSLKKLELDLILFKIIIHFQQQKEL